MTIDDKKPTTWWGDFTFETGQTDQWQIGPLRLVIQCLGNEWQVAYERLDETEDHNFILEHMEIDLLPESLEKHSRFIFRDTSGKLSITPLLADHPVISRPHIPFNLTAGEEVTLYVSSPLWVELAVGSTTKKVLQKIVIQCPSDTWFGPSTLERELCYATTTHCRLKLENLPQRPHRAITPGACSKYGRQYTFCGTHQDTRSPAATV